MYGQANEKATDETEKPTPTSVQGPIMTLESLTVNYGDIKQGSDPLRTVSFTNTGTEPLVISNAKGSCGCTVPTWPREPIAPGESAVIEIRYDTKRLGGINKTVKLTTNDETGTYVLRVKGNITAKTEEKGLPEKEGIFGEPDN
ncbi:MAG: hypothetical protein DRI69_01625 [Bacteroidetes bacterium]|nr:MAG: hypothetical protein DRI69_01625 [Bacteroidota bacterium]